MSPSKDHTSGLDYGVVGNCVSAALVHKTGSIDWFCLPDFNSYSVFAKILDDKKGGHFQIQTKIKSVHSQTYIKNTNILCTRFSSKHFEFELIDFMPRYRDKNANLHCALDLIRYIRIIRGKPVLKISYEPKLCYARVKTSHQVTADYIKNYTASGTYESVYLYSNLDLNKIMSSEYITLENDAFLWMSYNQKVLPVNLDEVILEFEKTKVYWLDWVQRTRKFKNYNEQVIRSALVLKLLTYQKSGAILAAVTTSIPETIGGVRNWDYRYCWIRDASMVISTLVRLGHYPVAKRFLKFILDVIPYKDDKIQIMYGINGEKVLKEVKLTHLKGYQNSSPVRIGNQAYKQKQHDIYGILLDVIYENFMYFRKELTDIETLWTVVRTLARTVQRNWKKKDHGIWEYRSQKKHFVFSKILCWVAIDRALKIAHILGRKEYYTEWSDLCDTIKEDIIIHGWNPERNAFTQSYGSQDLDASNLLMVTFGFLNAKDPKFISTVLNTQKELCHQGLMYRYKNKDDFGTPHSSFTICTFWLIKSLAQIGQHSEAVSLFENLLSYRNHVGLFSEDIDFNSKKLLGNFPQAYSHLALIDTAMTLFGESEHIEDRLSIFFN